MRANARRWANGRVGEWENDRTLGVFGHGAHDGFREGVRLARCADEHGRTVALATTSGNPIGSSDDRYHSAMRSHFLRKKSPETAAALSYPQSTNPAGQRDTTGFRASFTWSIWDGRPRRMIVFPGVGLARSLSGRATYLKECFWRQHEPLPTRRLLSVIRTPIC